MTDEPMKLWTSLACRELLKCFVNELFAAEIKKSDCPENRHGKSLSEKNMRLCPPLTSFRKRQNGFFWKGNETELKHTFLSSELAREWPEGVTFCEGIVYRLPGTGVSQTALQGPYPDRGKRHPEIAGRFAKKPDRGHPKILQQSRDLSSALWKDMALVISTLVLRYSLEALKASGPQKVYALAFCALALYIAISYGMSVYINRHALSLLGKTEPPGEVSYMVFWMNRIIRSWRVFPLIPQCGHITGLSE
jgi:hypothetical protein